MAGGKKKFRDGHWALVSMLLPAVILVFIFSYIPMPGIAVAFKSFRFNKGIWGSDWNGLERGFPRFCVNSKMII